jgi:glycosyltransferase involved in cell wall biosynthesis
LTQAWDAIVLDNIGCAHSLSAAKAYKVQNPATVLVYVSHEVEFETRRAKYGKYRINPLVRLGATLDLAKVKATEGRLLRDVDIVTVINQNDVLAFKAVVPNKRFTLISPGYDGSILQSRKIDKTTPRRVALLGGRTSQQKQQILLDWLEASYFALTSANIEIIVIGDVAPNLHRSVQEKYPQVILTGFVEDADALLDECRMGIVPDTMGGGFKLRQLTYAFRRVPMVGLDRAISGLPTVPGHGYLTAPDLKRLADLIVTSIDDTDKLNSVQERCFAECVDAFGWRARGELFAGLLSPKVGRARHETLEEG